MANTNLSPEEIAKRGGKLYLERYKDQLEKASMGQYAVFDVELERYQLDPDRLVAIEKAKKEFGDKLFYIVHIGSTQNPNVNYSGKKYAWYF